MFINMESMCKKIFWINEGVLKMWLWTYSQTNSELGTLLDAADFTTFLAMENFKHYELHKAVGCT